MSGVALFSLCSTPTTFQTSTYISSYPPLTYLLSSSTPAISMNFNLAPSSTSTPATFAPLEISEYISSVPTHTTRFITEKDSDGSKTTTGPELTYTQSITTPSSSLPTEICDYWNWPPLKHSTNTNEKRGNTPESTSQTALRQAIEAAIRLVMSQTYYECAVGKTLSGCELFGGGIVCGWVWEEPAPSPAPSQSEGAWEEGSVFWSEPAVVVEGGECEECGRT